MMDYKPDSLVNLETLKSYTFPTMPGRDALFFFPKKRLAVASPFNTKGATQKEIAYCPGTRTTWKKLP